MTLVEHTRRELELIGEDAHLIDSLVATVAQFESFGHSGGSLPIAADYLNRLLRYEPLTPIGSDPDEWEDRSNATGYPMWQNMRDPRAFSHDGGKTWWLVDSEIDLDKADNLTAQTGDPDLTKIEIDAGEIRETAEQLEAAGATRYAELVRTLDRQNAARGREMQRLKVLLSVGVADSMAAENAVLARQLVEATARHTVEADEWRKERLEHAEQYGKLQERCNQLAARSRMAYGAWAASEIRKVADS